MMNKRIRFLFMVYGKLKHIGLREIVVRQIMRIDGDVMTSLALRVLFRMHHGVTIGLYTHGRCFDPRRIDPRTIIGRWCSFGQNVRVITLNHPMHFKSTHSCFYDPAFGLCDEHLVDRIPHRIGNDVWIGDNAIILPSCTNVGDGAVIGAGAVVNKSVPPYAVVVGNPARVVRYRFSEAVIRELLASRWWAKSREEIAANLYEFLGPYEMQLNADASYI